MRNAAQRKILLSNSEQEQLQAVDRLLHGGAPALVSRDGERIQLPRTVFEVLKTAVKFMSDGQNVTLIPENALVTTQHAADILGMSRPFFIKLLESGTMPHHRVGNQRRIYLRDVLEYGQKRDQERLAALDRLARDAFEAGLYERNAIPKDGSDE